MPKKLPQMPFVRDKVDTRVTKEMGCPSQGGASHDEDPTNEKKATDNGVGERPVGIINVTFRLHNVDIT